MLTRAQSPLIRSFLLTIACWTAVAFAVSPRLRAHPEGQPRAIIQTGGTLIDKEIFFANFLTPNTGFSFAQAQYKGSILLEGLPDVIPPNATFTIAFPGFSSAVVQPIVIRMDDDEFYQQHMESGKFQFAINPFAANAIFDFGTAHGIKAPNHFDTGDPTLVGTLAFPKTHAKSGHSGMVFKLTTYARAGGAFNIIEGYVPSITAGVNTHHFSSGDGHKYTIAETATMNFSIPGGNTWGVTLSLSGDATLASKMNKDGSLSSYKISGEVDGAGGKPAAASATY